MDKINDAFEKLEELKIGSVVRLKSELENTKNRTEKEIRKSFYGYLRSSPQCRTVERFIQEFKDENVRKELQTRLNDILVDEIVG